MCPISQPQMLQSWEVWTPQVSRTQEYAAWCRTLTQKEKHRAKTSGPKNCLSYSITFPKKSSPLGVAKDLRALAFEGAAPGGVLTLLAGQTVRALNFGQPGSHG